MTITVSHAGRKAIQQMAGILGLDRTVVQDAACGPANADLFDPVIRVQPTADDRRRIRRAVTLCRYHCPVQAACLAWGQASAGYGVWGGQLLQHGKITSKRAWKGIL